jgi:hypothetical protein
VLRCKILQAAAVAERRQQLLIIPGYENRHESCVASAARALMTWVRHRSTGDTVVVHSTGRHVISRSADPDIKIICTYLVFEPAAAFQKRFVESSKPQLLRYLLLSCAVQRIAGDLPNISHLFFPCCSSTLLRSFPKSTEFPGVCYRRTGGHAAPGCAATRAVCSPAQV